MNHCGTARPQLILVLVDFHPCVSSTRTSHAPRDVAPPRPPSRLKNPIHNKQDRPLGSPGQPALTVSNMRRTGWWWAGARDVPHSFSQSTPHPRCLPTSSFTSKGHLFIISLHVSSQRDYTRRAVESLLPPPPSPLPLHSPCAQSLFRTVITSEDRYEYPGVRGFNSKCSPGSSDAKNHLTLYATVALCCRRTDGDLPVTSTIALAAKTKIVRHQHPKWETQWQ